MRFIDLRPDTLNALLGVTFLLTMACLAALLPPAVRFLMDMAGRICSC